MTFVHMKKKFIDKNKHFYTAKKVHTHIKLMHMQKSIKYTTKKNTKETKNILIIIIIIIIVIIYLLLKKKVHHINC